MGLNLSVVQASGAAEYGGKVGQADTTGIDTAYRILADHARMYTVAITDGLMPSRNGLGSVDDLVLSPSSFSLTLCVSICPWFLHPLSICTLPAD